MRSSIFTKSEEQRPEEPKYQTMLTQVEGYRVEDNQIVIYGIKGVQKHEVVIEFYNLETDHFFNLFDAVTALAEVDKGLAMRKVTTYSADGKPNGFNLLIKKVARDSVLEVDVPDEEASIFVRTVK